MANTEPTDCPYYLISRAYLVITSALKKALAEIHLGQVKPAYLGALMSLWNEDGLKVVELGQKAGLEPSTMTGLLDRMERDNLIKRSVDPDDRRAQKIHLTALGHESKDPVLKVVEQVLGAVFEDTSTDQLSHVKDTLRQILANSHKEIK